MSEPRWQGGLCAGGSQVRYAATGIGEPIPDKVSRAIDLLTRLDHLRLRQQMGGKLKLHRDADEPLRQRVVNLTRNAVAFREYRVELRTNCTNTHPVYRKDNGDKEECCEFRKPERAIELRLDGESDLCACCVPNAVFIGGLNAETILSRWKIGVVGSAAWTSLRPLFVKSFKDVAIAHARR